MTDIRVSFRVKSEVYFIFCADKKTVTFYRKRHSQNKQTEKQRSTSSRSAFIYTFNFTMSVYLNTRTSSRLFVMGFSELTWQNPFWRVVRAEITWQTPAWAGQDLFTQTAIAVSIKGEQEGRYVREVNRVWKVWRGKRRERFRTQHEIMKIWWSAAQLDHALICCDLYHCKAWHVK